MTLLELEKSHTQLTRACDGQASLRMQWHLMTGFLSRLFADFDVGVRLSYLLGLADSFVSLSRRAPLEGLCPEILRQGLDLCAAMKQEVPEAFEAESMAAAENRLTQALIQVWVVLNDWAEVERLLPFSLSDGQKTQLSQLAPFDDRWALLSRWGLPGSPDDTGTHPRLHGSQMPVLLVEMGVDDTHLARLSPLHLHVSSTPAVDVFRWNNHLAHADAQVERLRAGLGAVRQVLSTSLKKKALLQPSLFEFSIPETSAVFAGDSWGATTALLMAAALRNRPGAGRQTLLNQRLVMTGEVDERGRIAEVEARGLAAKLEAAFFSDVDGVAVPAGNRIQAEEILEALQRRYPSRKMRLLTFESLDALLGSEFVIQERVGLGRRLRFALSRPWMWLVFALAFFAAVRLWILPVKDRNPVQWQIEHNRLQVFNAEGKLLWTHPFEAVLDREYYLRFGEQSVFVDADGDGKNELLWGTFEKGQEAISGVLSYFDDDGDLLWQRKTGQPVALGQEAFSAHYRIRNVYARDLNGDGVLEICTIAVERQMRPCVVNVWDLAGNKLSEYWHWGHLCGFFFHDITGDGLPELLAVGVRNQWGGAVLVALDPFMMSGQCPPLPGEAPVNDSMPIGGELAYVLFPHSDFVDMGSRDVSYLVTPVGDRLAVAVSNPVITPDQKLFYSDIVAYTLTKDFVPLGVRFGDAYGERLRRVSGRPDIQMKPRTGLVIRVWRQGTWEDRVVP